LKYDEIFVNLAEDLVRKCEAKYKLSLTECNNVLESQRIALNTAMHCHQQSKDLPIMEIEGCYVSSFDKPLLDANDELERELNELKSDLLAEQHDLSQITGCAAYAQY
jgi:hypothetical protein